MVGDILGGPQINRGGASLSGESVGDARDADLFLAAPTIVPSLPFIVGPHLKATFLAPLRRVYLRDQQRSEKVCSSVMRWCYR